MAAFLTSARTPCPGPRSLQTIHQIVSIRMLHVVPKRAGLPRRRFHDLRHSAASLRIASGVSLVEVSMLLGHSELRVIADLYSPSAATDGGKGRASDGRDSRIVGQAAIAMMAAAETVKFSRDFGAGDQT
jgi:integrase